MKNLEKIGDVAEMEVESPSQIALVKEASQTPVDCDSDKAIECKTSLSNNLENGTESINGKVDSNSGKNLDAAKDKSDIVTETPTQEVNGTSLNGYDVTSANNKDNTADYSKQNDVKSLENGFSSSVNGNGCLNANSDTNAEQNVNVENNTDTKGLQESSELKSSQHGLDNGISVVKNLISSDEKVSDIDKPSDVNEDDCSDDIINASRALTEAAESILNFTAKSPESKNKEPKENDDNETFEIPKSIEELLEEDDCLQATEGSNSEETVVPSQESHPKDVSSKMSDNSKSNVEEDNVKAENNKIVNPVLMKFVDETSQENSDPEEEKPGQISLEAMDTQLSDEDTEDDIDAGLEKCFSALDKKLEKEKENETSRDTSPDIHTIKEKGTDETAIGIIKNGIEDASGKSMNENGNSSSSRGHIGLSNNPSDIEDVGGHEGDDEDTRMSAPEIAQEEKEEPMDFEKALGELEMIEKKTRKILDDESESGKRPTSENNEEPITKKPKLDEVINEDLTSKNIKKKLKKELKKLTRVALEDIIATKMVEVMTNKSEIGQLRHQCDSFADTVEKWKRRAAALSKQCTDLSTVMRKYITDSKNRPKDKVAPVRITRSVGLQVITPDQRRLQQQRQNLAARQQAARAAAAARRSPAVTPGTPAVSRSTTVSPRPAVSSTPSTPTVRPLVSTQARQVGGTTISPAKSSPTTQIRPGGSVTITQTKKPTDKPVIDVVDLSDDDSAAPVQKTTTATATPTTNIVRQVVTNPPGLRGTVTQQNRPRVGYAPYRPTRPTGPRGPMLLQRAPSRVALKTGGQHPAPLPPMPNPQPNSPAWKLLPPRPALKISRVANGIVLSWNMNINQGTHAAIASYQLYAYQESSHQRPDPQLWKKVGDVKALPLPMACTLTQFTRGNKYHFAVRAMDAHSRVGQFSEPNSIVLN